MNEPHLITPTTDLRDSYLAGERADLRAEGEDERWLDAAEADFAAFVAGRRGVHERWGVPSTYLWYARGAEYLGTLVIRHRLTPELEAEGGHVGYHVVFPHRRQGHATRMLRAGLDECRVRGLDRVLLTCRPDNEPSKRVIRANGGVPAGRPAGEDRFWIDLT
ncbi:GNAT family N-acetyltransferase [Actinomadura parmotrematis]|uniref:GNAT family N-acetyltransferase n=1 Tax=Actinomadura parmotrematis TaxID=2864039 RepID=A0ABS7FPL7_9ACTN|nr:GNAT family N-acetyltransferase [Actinomadura parmotrematis]MBW8482317.1 GNAT family N-acetyltransferase [Actinomadura parmotrematis]